MSYRFSGSETLREDLGGRSVRGGTVMMSVQGCKLLLNVGSTAVLARMLTPDDFGAIAMVAAVTRFVALFKDMGLTMATVQRAEVNHEQITALFWVNVGVGIGIMALTAVAAPAVAWFYTDPRLESIVQVFALGFLFSGLSAQHSALMRREMRFSMLGSVEFVALFVGIAVAILMATAGFGYWALAGKELTSQGLSAAGLWIACGWRPGVPSITAGIGPMLTFGRNTVLAGVLIALTRNLDKVLLGWRWGTGPLGFYSMAYNLLFLPIQQISGPVTSVAVPVLSRLQGEPDKYRQYFRRGIMLVVSLGMPVVCFAFMDADRIVNLVLGERWEPVALIFRVLGPAAFISTFNVATGWVYLSLGLTGRRLRWQLFMTIAMAVAFAIGLKWGAVGVAAGCSGALVLLTLPGLLYCYRGTGVTVSDLALSIWRPALASIAAGVATYICTRRLLIGSGEVVELIVDVAAFAGLYLACWVVLPGGKGQVLDVVRLSKELRRPAQ